MAYTPPSPFVFIVESGYSPPSPFVFRIGEASSPIAYGAVEQPVDSVSGEAVSPNACTGDFQQPVDSVSAIQLYNSGDFQGVVDSVSGEATSPLVATGTIEQQVDSISGGAVNGAPVADWIAGDYQQPVDKVRGGASNFIGVGRISPYADTFQGSAITPIVCTGKFRPRVDSVSAFGLIAESIGIGTITQNVDSILGTAITSAIANGDFRQKVDSIIGVATSPYVRFAYGTFSQKTDSLYGSAFSIIPAIGIVNQSCDKLTGSAWSTNVCVGNVSSKFGTVHGIIKQINSYQNLHFLRDEIIQPENDSVNNNNNSLQFSYNTIITGTSSVPGITPIHFERLS